MLKKFSLVLIGIFLIIADQAIKGSLLYFLQPNETIPVIKDIFHITVVLNTGCAFGLLKNVPSGFFMGLSLCVVAFLIYSLNRIKEEGKLLRLGFVFIISGAVSNLIDRVRLGCVVDFLDFRIWPVFNLADTVITIGASIIILQLLLKQKKQV